MQHLTPLLTAAFLFTNMTFAQIAQDTSFVEIDTPVQKAKTDSAPKKREDYNFTVGSNGVRISTPEQDSIRKTKTVTIGWMQIDLGINALNDRTDYRSAAAQQFLQVP